MEITDRILQLEQEADSLGFRWENTSQIMDQIESECQEIRAELQGSISAESKMKLQEEIGDLFHAVFSLCAFCRLDPSETLKRTTDKFEQRLKAVRQIAQNQGLTTLEGFSFSELMEIWRQAKSVVSENKTIP